MKLKLAALVTVYEIILAAVTSERSDNLPAAATYEWRLTRAPSQPVLVPAQDFTDYRDHPGWREEY